MHKEGEPGEAIYTIVKGQAEVVKQLTDETERHLGFLTAGEVFGEIAILQQHVRTATRHPVADQVRSGASLMSPPFSTLSALRIVRREAPSGRSRTK